MDWQSMPKGSPERKAAVREQRRNLAAAARAKKVAKSRSAGPARPDEGSAVEAVDDVGDQELSYREVIEWVWERSSRFRRPRARAREPAREQQMTSETSVELARQLALRRSVAR